MSSSRTWKPEELPCQVKFFKYSSIAKQRTLWIFWPGTTHGSFWSMPIIVHSDIWAASRDEAREIPKRTNDTENCMISVIWPFLESTGDLPWPKVWHTIFTPSVSMLFRISSKVFAYRASEEHWSVFFSILTMHRLTHRNFLQKWLNPQKPRSAESTFQPTPDLAASDFFPFVYLEEKLRGTSFTTSDDLIFAIRQIFCGILEIVLKNVFTNWTRRLSWSWRRAANTTPNAKKNRIIFIL
jgi:hypothetical protein